MERFLIVDGSNLLFQMFYGMPARIVNESGRAIHGTLGFVGALLKIIRMTKPTRLVVLFDGEHANPRTELDDTYKGNRPDFGKMPEEETPFSQLADVYAALDFLKISHSETVLCETDDWIAGYVAKYEKGYEIFVASFDSDFFQLIRDNVSIIRYRGDNTLICTPSYLEEKFGILPSQYADWKSMVGDAADNIKGAEKIGAKTATELLREYGNLDGILHNVSAVKKPSIRKSIIQNADRLRTNYRLIRLESCHELPFPIEELGYTDTGIATNEVLRGIGLKR